MLGSVKVSTIISYIGAIIAIVLPAVVCGVLIVYGVSWFANRPESGVLMSNEMEQYAIDYLDQNNILNDSEELIMYYDASFSLDGSEAAILTTDRMIYHKGGRTTSLDLVEIEDITHRTELFVGDVIEIKGDDGTRFKVEISPFSQGYIFFETLLESRNNAREENEL